MHSGGRTEAAKPHTVGAGRRVLAAVCSEWMDTLLQVDVWTGTVASSSAGTTEGVAVAATPSVAPTVDIALRPFGPN